MEWVYHNVAEELINITSTREPTTHESMFNNVVQDLLRYYVDMPIIFTIINLEFVFLIKNLVEILEQPLVDVGVECRIPKT
jgi:hypothetical protein